MIYSLSIGLALQRKSTIDNDGGKFVHGIRRWKGFGSG